MFLSVNSVSGQGISSRDQVNSNHHHHHAPGVPFSIAASLKETAALRRNTASFASNPFGTKHGRTESCTSLHSLVFELELEEEKDTKPAPPRLPREWDWGKTEEAAQLWSHAIAAKEQLLSQSGVDDGTVDVVHYAQLLADAGYPTWLRKGTYTSPPETGLGTIKHTFVVASLPGQHPGQPAYYVVDPNWKDHFRLAGTGTGEYQQLLALLPPVFVGCAEQVISLVNFLCLEMEKVFLSRGVPLPPWRSPRAMNRWLVNQVEDTQMLPANTDSDTEPVSPVVTAAQLQPDTMQAAATAAVAAVAETVTAAVTAAVASATRQVASAPTSLVAA